MVLEETGSEYELVLVDRKVKEQKSADYIKLNPTGRIPTLTDGEIVVFESAAICLHICEKKPQSGLIPNVGDPLRAQFYQWLFYLNATVQPELMVYFYPEKHTKATDTAALVSEAQEGRVTEMFDLLDRELEGKKFLVGDSVTLCDFFLFMLAHWAAGFEQPPLSWPNLGRYLRGLSKRPSVVKVCATEGISLDAYNYPTSCSLAESKPWAQQPLRVTFILL